MDDLPFSASLTLKRSLFVEKKKKEKNITPERTNVMHLIAGRKKIKVNVSYLCPLHRNVCFHSDELAAVPRQDPFARVCV